MSDNRKNKTRLVSLLLILSVLIILLLLRSCINENESSIVVDDTGLINSNESNVGGSTWTNNSIAIPGYETLTLYGGNKKQNINLINPHQNNCYFIISLILHDGTQLWRSDYVGPGELSDEIVLDIPLEEGLYIDTVLKYECFTFDESKTPLNGAEIIITLIVK